MLTRKDFKAVAEIIGNIRLPQEYSMVNVSDPIVAGIANGILVTKEEIAKQLADYFATQNSRFDRERFMAACGLRDE